MYVITDEFGRVIGKRSMVSSTPLADGWKESKPLDYGLASVRGGFLDVGAFWAWFDELPIV